jgi:alginate O-acetyltransferase complex protein AlgI
MARGLGRMLGFEFCINFNYPYISKSVTEFWRRWHISLSSWFRDYVYIPLGGSRTGKTIRNLFIVWALTGLWHGANWTFVAWGLFYFILLCLEKFCGLWANWPVWLRRPWTFLLVNFGWVLFRAEDLTHAGQYLSALFGSHAWASAKASLLFRENLPVLIFSILFMVPFVPLIRDRLSTSETPCPKPLAAAGGILGGTSLALLMLICLCYLVKGSYNPFIYFNF